MANQTPTHTAPSRGRPRDATRDAAIHRATVELLTEDGYDRMSMGAIAERAGVSKATIYRRWANKAELVAAAIDQRAAGTPPTPEGVDLRDDLLTVLGWLAVEIAGQDMALLTTVLAAKRTDRELAAAMRQRLHRDEASMIDEPLRRAAERGERLVPDAGRLFAEVGPAVIGHRLLLAGEACDEAFVTHVVDDVLLPLLRARDGD